MSIFKGTLSIISNQSSLNGHLLLKAGIPDMSQAIFAATQFLVKIRHLNSGQLIQVIGDQSNGLNAIIMQDAQALLLGVEAEALSFDAVTAEKELMVAFTEADTSATTENKTQRIPGKAKSVNAAEKKPTRAKRKSNSVKKDK